MTRSKQPIIGDIYAIDLGNGSFAYGRVMHEGLQIFTQRSTRPEDFNRNDLAQDFVVGLYFDAYKDTRMKVIDRIPFATEDEAWPPPTYIKDPIRGTYSVYFKGNITSSSYDDCRGMEPTSAWELNHLIDRINGDTKWIEKLV